MWVRRLLVTAFLALVGGPTSCTIWHDAPSGEQPSPPCEHHECAFGTKACHGDKPADCIQDSSGCHVWSEGTDCTEVGATCSEGMCVFDESCPSSVDAFCRNGHLLQCPLQPYFTADPCDPDVTCQEVVAANGRTQATCATSDPPCADTEGSVVECRGDDRLECWYGLVVARQSCAPYRCETFSTDSGETAGCGLREHQ